jgi:hypothetical protein
MEMARVDLLRIEAASLMLDAVDDVALFEEEFG